MCTTSCTNPLADLAGAVALGENLLGRAEVVFDPGLLAGEFRATAVATIKLAIHVIVLGVTVLVAF